VLCGGRFAAAELDCSIALSLDPLYTKAYLRRGAARLGLAKYVEAKADCERVLQLEPNNKKAKTDLEQIEKVDGLNIGNDYLMLLWYNTEASNTPLWH